MEHGTVRKVLGVDAITCLAAGVAMLAGSGPLAELTALPQPLLRAAGMALLPVAALFAWMSRTNILSGPLLTLAVVGNAAWVLASLAVLMLVPANGWGYAVVLGQAAMVALLAALEARGLGDRRAVA